MSEKSRGDTSTPIVRVKAQNPLLSASITGFTIDQPLLLPAAPLPQPIVPGLVHRDTKSLVVVGKATDIDTENLDEINLNSSSEDTQPAQIDTNTNTLLEPNITGTDSILSQAASSFSALPTVASNVFSTFSKRIYSGSSSRESTPVTENISGDSNANVAPQLYIQPSYIQEQTQLPLQTQSINLQQQQQYTGVPPPTIFQPTNDSNKNPILTAEALTTQASEVSSAALPLPEPPRFYTPADVPTLPTVGVSNTNIQNNYRLSAKKKIYAPIPGLTDQSYQAAPTINPLTVNAPTQFPPIGTNTFNPSQQNTFAQEQQTYTQPIQQEERKGGLFSLTNLVPTGVLQNLSGLVQSAAGSITQSIRSDTSQSSSQSHMYQQPSSTETLGVNYFGVTEQQITDTAAPPSLYCTPNTGLNNTAQVSNIYPPANDSFTTQTQTSTEPLVVNTQNSHSTVTQNVPITTLPVDNIQTTINSESQVPLIENNSFNASSFFNASSASNASKFPTEQIQQVPYGTVTPILQPIFTEDQSANLNVPLITANIFTPPSVPTVTGVQSSTILTATQPTVITEISSSLDLQSVNNIKPKVEILQTVVPNQTTPPSASTPAVGATNQPPPISIGPTSFRLQKGTRLYKSPLSEIEKSYHSNEQQQPISQAPNPFLNPFATLETNITTNAQFPNIFIPAFSPGQSTTSFEHTVIKSVDPLNYYQPNETVVNPTETEIIQENIEVPITQLPEPQSTNLFTYTENVTAATKEFFSAENSPQEEVKVNEQEQSVNTVSLTETKKEELNLFTLQESINEQIQKDITLDELVQNLTIETEPKTSEVANFLPPPPHTPTSKGASNPYSRKSTGPPAVSTASISSQPSLANFFTPATNDNASAVGFNFFTTPEPKVEPQQHTTNVTTNPLFTEPQQTSQPSTTNISNFFSKSIENTTSNPTENIFDKTDNNGTVQQGIFPPLPPLSGIAPPPLTQENPTENYINQKVDANIAPPPIGFDNIATETYAARAIESSAVKVDENFDSLVRTEDKNLSLTNISENIPTSNLFSNYFAETSNLSNQQTQQQKLPDPVTFFDSFAPQTDFLSFTATAPPLDPSEQLQTNPQTIPTNEDQRINNFFNNPPPKESGSGIGDLNYDLVHTGLAVKNLQTRSLTPISNVVEPPSSSCSEFSELNNSANSALKLNLDAETEKSKATKIEPITNVAESSSLTSDNAIQTKHYEELPEDILQSLRMANLLTSEKGEATVPPTSITYTPAIKHWFYKRTSGTKFVWTPFSHYDSALLETSITDNNDNLKLVAVEGGRYDVDIVSRTKMPVYWQGDPIEVRRCSWFYKATDSKYVPYDEETADLLEIEYKQAAESGVWHKKIIIAGGEQIVFHGPTVIVHFQQQRITDAWGGNSQPNSRPRVVKRDLDDFAIEQGESQRVDHLLLMVHGIGAACDLKLRSVEEVVDDFRTIAQQLVQSHYKNSTEMGTVGRVEVLPISWHSHLHSEEMGIDEKLKAITLESIPKLRNFTNDTLLDILFYTSPTYCQKIINTVAKSMNDVYFKYRERHPEFSGGVSVAGHSLGSLILFDLLCHQNPVKECEDQNMENPDDRFAAPKTSVFNENRGTVHNEVGAKQISYTMGPAGTGQPYINYAQLLFQPKKFFALGSPIGMFVTVRGIDKLGLDFRLPTCSGFYNIFHPFDPVAYRIEALVNPEISPVRPVLIPHHKGRKRMHLELKETMTRVGADLKARFFDTFKTTLGSVNFLSTKSKKEEEEALAKEVDKVLQMQIEKEELEQQQRERAGVETKNMDQNEHETNNSHSMKRSRVDSFSTVSSDTDAPDIDIPLGKLNDSKRIDYVLQEAPLEFFNEYIFALSSHVCYWESEDTILFIMKEIYSGLGVSPDSQVPQQSMTIERPNSRNSVSQTLLSPTN